MPTPNFAAEAERIRQRTMDTLMAAFSELSEGMLIVDRQARIVWMNEKYPRHLGIADPASVIGLPVEDVIPNSLMRSVVTSGKPIMLDIMEFGSESFVVMRLPVRDAAGELIGGVGVMIFDDPRQLMPLVSRFQSLRLELADTRRKLDEARRSKYTFTSFVGASPRCVAVKDKARRAARASSPVLILGETGTGKELLAHAIHAASPRAAGPFVAVNIAAIPDTLLESELFGHKRGAFTGAFEDHPGLFQRGNGGTVFLDEIGETSPAFQVKLLRVLQEGEVRPVGGVRPIQVNVRVIAATHRQLEQRVRDGLFREDLYYRLAGIGITVPPLRERVADIAPIARQLALDVAAELGHPGATLPDETLACLLAYPWPGNIRELRNEIARALALHDGEALPPGAFSARVLQGRTGGGGDLLSAVPQSGTLSERLDVIEAMLLRETLLRHRWNKTRAAQELGLSRVGLRGKMHRFGLGDP